LTNQKHILGVSVKVPTWCHVASYVFQIDIYTPYFHLFRDFECVEFKPAAQFLILDVDTITVLYKL
jgi:hypothetical protein